MLLFAIASVPAVADVTSMLNRTTGEPAYGAGYSVQQTSDGGYIITGATKSYGSGGNSALWLIKTDAFGDETWDRTFGDSGWNEGKSVEQTSDDGYIITGSTYPYGVSVRIELFG